MVYIYNCKSSIEVKKGILHAKKVIELGECIIIPTDTVYGIATSPFIPYAVDNLLSYKQRNVNMPPPILISNKNTLSSLVEPINDEVKRLIKCFWPGPLTLILKSQTCISWNYTHYFNNIAVRIPNNPIILNLLNQIGPLAVSSANISGNLPAPNAYLASKLFDKYIKVYLNDNNKPFINYKTVSTILDCRMKSNFKILREGAINKTTLRNIVPTIFRN